LRYILTIAAVLVAASVSSEQLHQEFPVESDAAVVIAADLDETKCKKPATPREPGYLHELLTDMPPAERDAAAMRLIDMSESVDSKSLASIEDSWNSGDFQTSIDGLISIENETGPGVIGVMFFATKPQISSSTDRWGGDVRVGDLDSTWAVDLDVHYATGNLFAVAVADEGTKSAWEYYFSDDGGDTWGWRIRMQNVDLVNDVDLTVVGDYAYIASSVSGSNKIELVRALSSTGYHVHFPNDSFKITALTIPDSDVIEEIELESNQDFESSYADRIYLLAITELRDLWFSWSDPANYVFNGIPTGVHDADRGLDVAITPGYSTYWLYASYVRDDDYLVIDGYNTAPGWVHLTQHALNSPSPGLTSISGWNDTTICCFEYYSGTRMYNRYLINYGTGSWFYGQIDDTTVTSEAPAVTRRRGQGMAAVYRDYHTYPRELRYAWRPCGTIAWEGKHNIADHAPYWSQAAIQPLGDNTHGVLYISLSDPVERSLFFDRGSCCSIRADINDDGSGPDISDLVFLVSYMFSGGPEPPCMLAADINGDGSPVPDISDLVYLVAYMFSGGPAPVACP